MIETFDYAVIGGGIAGASIAAELAATGRVVLLERESQSGYHSTGRSAAAAIGSYGNATVRELSAESIRFYRDPPVGFAETELFRQRDILSIANSENADALVHRIGENDGVMALSPAAARQMVPILSQDYVATAAIETDCGDLEVDTILQSYLKLARARGARVLYNAPVSGLVYDGDRWRIASANAEVAAEVVVNAAGAWAEQVAELAGANLPGLAPLRRTAMLISLPGFDDFKDWPLVLDFPENMYFRPDAGKLLLSPANEDPAEPSDVQPDELDIAIGIDRFQRATGLDVRRIDHSWAGLRTFASDRTPVVGFDPDLAGFFWFAGQGGYGVQMAPGLARLGAEIARGSATRAGLVRAIAPSRFRPAHEVVRAAAAQPR